mmetsp:Transcript_59712/g.94551  ORF Transcript_59712/g.94551 Transcript_59712/m.94551 type:complete len:226 (+) Transcript_59712:625-1302(+)
MTIGLLKPLRNLHGCFNPADLCSLSLFRVSRSHPEHVVGVEGKCQPSRTFIDRSKALASLVIIFLSDFVVQFSLQLFLTDLGGDQLKEFCSLVPLLCGLKLHGCIQQLPRCGDSAGSVELGLSHCSGIIADLKRTTISRFGFSLKCPVILSLASFLWLHTSTRFLRVRSSITFFWTLGLGCTLSALQNLDFATNFHHSKLLSVLLAHLLTTSPIGIAANADGSLN